MINLLGVTIKNFFSVGAITQSIDLNSDNLTLVLGSNLDIGEDSENSKNGVGKSAILNAISYALYGVSLSNVKKGNLINKTNKKHMLVTLSFEKDGVQYRIERGRSPTFLKFFIDDTEQEITDESQGDSRKTQEYIESLLGMSHDMFTHIVALNTYTTPFLSMRAGDQRSIIEQLLGVTLLSEKAESLKLNIKNTKEQIQVEKSRIDALESSNKRIQETIKNLSNKQSLWKQQQCSEIKRLKDSLTEYTHLDIDSEIEKHEKAEKYKKYTEKRDFFISERERLVNVINSQYSKVENLSNDLDSLNNHVCYTCGQSIHKEKQQEITRNKQNELIEAENTVKSCSSELENVENSLSELKIVDKPAKTFYDTIKQAYDHQNNVNRIQEKLVSKQNEVDPYHDQIEELKNTALSEIDWSMINVLDQYREHQEFLLKLLTNKDSFIRKKIIDQNLLYLNNRLTYYLSKLGLPHVVEFLNDLSVNISILGQDLDFDNLSRGERTRLVLGLSFAFRDVWEHLKHNINLLFIDELLDSGLDGAGIENSLSVLKHISRNRRKNIFLVSHREEFIGRVNNTLMVIKENGFTHVEPGETVQDHVG